MVQTKERRLLVALMAFMLAFAGFMAFTVQSAWADDETVDVTFALIIPDGEGEDAYAIDYTKTTMPADSTAWDLTEKMFKDNDIEYDFSAGTEYGVYLNWILSPITGEKVLSWDYETESALTLFENGEYSMIGAEGIILEDGDSIVWRYGVSDMDNPMALDDKTKPMYRVYNPNSGEHFYTMSEGEKDYLVSLGWNFEKIEWIAPLASTVPVYRLYNANGGEHHYTMSKFERDSLVKVGWSDEGIGWYSDAHESTVLYREYNPNAFANNHNYTTSETEHEHLLSIGWKDEGTAWFGVPNTL